MKKAAGAQGEAPRPKDRDGEMVGSKRQVKVRQRSTYDGNGLRQSSRLCGPECWWG